MLALVQFDAASLSLVERMLSEGRLPALAALLQRGRWQPLEVGHDLFEAGTYPVLYSGQDLGEHGLYYPFVWSAAEQRLRYMDVFPTPQTVWERLAEAGRPSLVIDPYQLWAPSETLGASLSGWQFRHKIIPGWWRPRSAYRRLARSIGRPPLLNDVAGPRSAPGLLKMYRDLLAGPGRAAGAVVELMARESFDLVWVTFIAAHQAGHQLWDLPQLRDGDDAPALRRTMASALPDVYEAVDAAIRTIVQSLPADADVIAFSSLGMGAQTSRSDLLPDMLAAVLGDRRGRPRRSGGGAGSSIWRHRAAVPPRWRAAVTRVAPGPAVRELVARLYLRDVDWQRTRALVLPGDHYGYVRLNVQGREREGIVDPAETVALTDEIATGLETFCDPDGSPSIASVERAADRIAGPRADRLPDLVVRWSSRPTTHLTGVTSPNFGDIPRPGVGSGRPGNHTDGAWALIAPGASRMRKLGRPPQLLDIAATACALLGASTEGLAGEALLERA